MKKIFQVKVPEIKLKSNFSNILFMNIQEQEGTQIRNER